jgi:mRNA-degrading endonuclease RelE of RelBE toxin-antitoxin system
MKIIFTATARSRILALHPLTRRLIRQGIDLLFENPYLGKVLQDDLLGFRSLPCMRYRIIYEINEAKKEILIHTVGHREDVYELFSTQMKRKN